MKWLPRAESLFASRASQLAPIAALLDLRLSAIIWK